MGYFEWHGEPGYWRDVTRHFPADARLLDIGCGDAWLAGHFPNYTGIDSSPEAVHAADAHGYSIVQGDVTQPLPFPDSSFDSVVMKDLLEHLPNPVAAVKEARRVLEPGGTLFASAPDAQRWVWDDYTHLRPYSRKAFRLLFSDAGFAVRQIGYESVMPGTSIVSGWTRSHRRPWPLRAAAWLPFVRRNVWLVADPGK